MSECNFEIDRTVMICRLTGGPLFPRTPGEPVLPAAPGAPGCPSCPGSPESPGYPTVTNTHVNQTRAYRTCTHGRGLYLWLLRQTEADARWKEMTDVLHLSVLPIWFPPSALLDLAPQRFQGIPKRRPETCRKLWGKTENNEWCCSDCHPYRESVLSVWTGISYITLLTKFSNHTRITLLTNRARRPRWRVHVAALTFPMVT